MDFWTRIGGTKTLKLVIGTVLTAVGGLLTDRLELADAMILIVNALGLLFVRDGVAKQQTTSQPS